MCVAKGHVGASSAERDAGQLPVRAGPPGDAARGGEGAALEPHQPPRGTHRLHVRLMGVVFKDANTGRV